MIISCDRLLLLLRMQRKIIFLILLNSLNEETAKNHLCDYFAPLSGVWHSSRALHCFTYFLRIVCDCFWSWESFQEAKTGKANTKTICGPPCHSVDFALLSCYPLKFSWLESWAGLQSLDQWLSKQEALKSHWALDESG